jgi:hypothetical protein
MVVVTPPRPAFGSIFNAVIVPASRQQRLKQLALTA